jgi:hypothetical protein
MMGDHHAATACEERFVTSPFRERFQGPATAIRFDAIYDAGAVPMASRSQPR